MAQQLDAYVENNFTKGLITETTGLNFPENAATAASNCEFTVIGDVTRRLGYDLESTIGVSGGVANVGRNSYVWTNVGGDGTTKVLVKANGSLLTFYSISTATNASPISTRLIPSTISLLTYVATGGVFDPTQECQFSSGNGYLFVYHPNCDTIYCTYAAGTITANLITVQIRDFVGITEMGVPVGTRPTVLSNEHLYNIKNQGWIKNPPWNANSSSSVSVATGSRVFTVAASLPITNGDAVICYTTTDQTPGGVLVPAGSPIMSGIVSGYTGTTLTLNITSASALFGGGVVSGWLVQSASDYITGWHTAIGNYPSNADVWWSFKNSSNAFDPTTTINNVSLSSTPAPQGHYVLNAFNQQRDLVSGVASITDVITTVRPKTGTWFQGRVWYTGVDAQQPATGDAQYYSWTENIYFSQVVQTPADFGLCYQTNDPTSETLFDLLPTDGGVINIQGCGSIYKLFALQNAMLVFAANGVWYLTGSQGIGFAANDYTPVKLSSVQSTSCNSYVDVNGLPYFWNEEGIYAVEPAKQGAGLLNSPLHVNPLEVNPVTVGTILTFYNNIPFASKKYARGAYHPIDYTIQWTYRSTQETDVSDRYNFDSILNFNSYNKAFFPYTISSGTNSPFIDGINYISYPQAGSDVPDPGFKYPMHYTSSSYRMGLAEESDENYVDWASLGTGSNYISTFTTGFKLKGQAIKKFQPQYIQIYSKTNGAASSYKIQGLWDFANDRSSGRWSTEQLVTNALTKYDTIFRRHRIRGHGYVLQFKITSADGMPFDIQGWSVVDTINAGT